MILYCFNSLTNSKIDTSSQLTEWVSQSAAKQTRLCDHASCVPVMMMMNGNDKSSALDSSSQVTGRQIRNPKAERKKFHQCITSTFYVLRSFTIHQTPPRAFCPRCRFSRIALVLRTTSDNWQIERFRARRAERRNNQIQNAAVKKRRATTGPPTTNPNRTWYIFTCKPRQLHRF